MAEAEIAAVSLDEFGFGIPEHSDQFASQSIPEVSFTGQLPEICLIDQLETCVTDRD